MLNHARTVPGRLVRSKRYEWEGNTRSCIYQSSRNGAGVSAQRQEADDTLVPEPRGGRCEAGGSQSAMTDPQKQWVGQQRPGVGLPLLVSHKGCEAHSRLVFSSSSMLAPVATAAGVQQQCYSSAGTSLKSTW